MKNLAVFVSGYGSNLQAIMEAVRRGTIKARIVLVVSNRAAAYALKRARKAKIKTLLVQEQDFTNRQDYDQEVIRHLKAAKVDFVILAGFMRLLSPQFIRTYRHRIVNVHPSLLPAFKGTRAIADALNYGVKVTGVTIHFVDEKVDHGPIILQEALLIKPRDTPASLAKRIHALEHRLYPKVIELLVRGKLKVRERRVAT